MDPSITQKSGLQVETDDTIHKPREYEKVYYTMKLSGESHVVPKQVQKWLETGKEGRLVWVALG